MAINFTDFSRAPIQESPWANALENAFKGYQLSQMPRQMADEAQKRKLANAMSQLKLDQEPARFEKEQAYKEALINKARNTPAGGTLKPSGELANYIYSHPNASQDEIKEVAEKLYKSALEKRQQSSERMKTLNKTQELRGSSPVSKIYNDIQKVEQGKNPTTGEDITPERQQQWKNSLMMDLIKKTTDPKARNQLINANNMNITLDSINPDDLVTYSGIKNKAAKLGDSILEGSGRGSERYQKYVDAVQRANAAAKQMRLYLQTSIQPYESEQLKKLTNPEAWNVSPATAKKQFEFMRNLMKRESNTLVRAMTDPTLYTNAFSNTERSSQSAGFNFSEYPVAGE